MDIKENVKYYLRQKGLSQVELANHLGISKVAIQSRITGNPTLKTLTEIADFIGIPVAALLAEHPYLQSEPIQIRCPECGHIIKLSVS